MAKFTVDPETLRAAAQNLDQIRTDLHTLATLPASDRDALGGIEVFTWFEQFSSAWSYGANQIDSSMSGLIANLNQAAKTYHDGEAYITTAATDHGTTVVAPRVTPGLGGSPAGAAGSIETETKPRPGPGGTVPDGNTAGMTATQQRKVEDMTREADSLLGTPYSYGGGHAGSQFGPSIGASGVGVDCSGFVSAVLHSAGYLSSTQTTDSLPGQPGIENGPGEYVTIYDRTSGDEDLHHVIIEINGQFYEAGGEDGPWRPGGEAVAKIERPPASYLSEFNLKLHPAGL